jgi:NAD(P)-dependent dehydrogenase (short-subunit alcohol dehydrogenase family)
MVSKNQSVVVTGVSTGIGWGISKILIANGFQVYGSVRRQTDADRLADEFGGAFTPLVMDVTDRESVNRAALQVDEQLGSKTLRGLVNNAGIAINGPLLYLPLEDYRRQLEVNLIAPLSVTQAFAPLLGTDRKRQGNPGRVINISSTGGKIGVPFLGAYVASKHGLEGMSETLRRELMIHGIDVIVVAPGSVVTAIWDKAEAEDLSAYAKTEYRASIDRFRSYFRRGQKRSSSRTFGRSRASRTHRTTTAYPLCSSTSTLQKLDIATAITEKVARYAHWQADWSDGSGLLRNHKVTRKCSTNSVDSLTEAG